MASPATVAPQVNGVASLSRSESPASVNSSTKRKRDASEDADADAGINGHEGPKPTLNGVHTPRDEKPLIRDVFDVLHRLDPISPGILKRPLPDSLPDGEPSAKRAKSGEDGKPVTIADKVAQEVYDDLEGLFADLSQATTAQIKELESSGPDSDPCANDEAIAKVAAFKTKAFDLYRRELAYPGVPRPSTKSSLRDGLPPSASGGLVLTTVGAAPTLRPLFTSLQRASTPDGVLKPIVDDALPNGITTTQILPDIAVSSDKNGRTLTLGELFPSPRNLPPLQPPKPPKNATKGNVLTFYHPELTEKSKYRAGTYFSQPVSAGHWLDYSNATPTTHAKTKQRERAQSLAGHKPSSTELEMSEMEALFRGAFSSFAPSKDDSAAIISSRQVSRVWWTRVGQRSFNKLVESEMSQISEDGDDDGDAAASVDAMEFDEERVKSVIDSWDDSLIDPSLDEVVGKSAEDKDTDDLLEEVSNLIETLVSFQRIRNLALPTSQDRYSADPVNGDMLRNGSLSHQPSEEEMLTYQTLKAHLSLIISTLPPFAVARLNSDKLAELSVSTKIEVRTDEYKGVMEEDEPARLARQAAHVAANSNQRQQHRVSSVGAASPFPNQQYPGHFTPSARPISNTQHFPQTPSRAQVPNIYQQRPPSTVPIPQGQHYNQPRPQAAPQYRAQAGPVYAPQLAKAQTPYGHSNMPPYVASPTQPRMPQHPNYNNMGPVPTPNQRYPQGYQPGFQQPHQQPHQPLHPQNMHPSQSPHPQYPQHAQHGQHSPLPPQSQHPQMHAQMGQHPQHPQQPGYSPYANGQPIPRNMTPQAPQGHGYNQTPTPPQQHPQIPRAPYGSPGIPPNSVSRPYGGAPQPNMMQQGPRATGLTGYATVMPEVQQRQVLEQAREQARARADAEQRASGHMGKVTQGEVVGLAGIGLGGTYDVNKIAAAKMQMGANNGMSPSPRMQMTHAGLTPANGTGPGGPLLSPGPLSAQVASPAPPAHMQAQAQTQMQARQSPAGQGFKPPAAAPAPV